MGKIRFIFSLLSLLAMTSLYAQDVNVTGTVTDAQTGEPVPFASIQLKGTLTGGSTDADGNYSILVYDDAVLIFSYIGYQTQEVEVAGRPAINVALEPDAEMLDETIVVAFGTSTKESFTGSATVVKSSDIARVQSSEPTRALEGMVAGVQMTTSSGSLGSSPSIMIRGISSINAGTAPLYVVDGVPYSGDLDNINPSDIESMTVLKDAASNALYGARGANGVIMITTKKAKAGEAVVNVDAKWGWNTKALKEYDYITDPGQYYETHYAALYNSYVRGGSSPNDAWLKANANLTGSSSAGGLEYMTFTVPEGQTFIGTNGRLNPNATPGRKVTYDGQDYWLQPDNWMDAAYRQSLRQEYNVSVSGSVDKATFFASFGYLNNKGISDGSDMYRYTARLKADYQAKNWLRVGANAAYTNFRWNNGNSDEGSSSSTGNVFAFASSIAPIYPIYMRDGNGNIMTDSRGWKMYDYGDKSFCGLVRPVFSQSNALQSVLIDKQYSEGNALNGTGYAEVSFLRDFKFTFNVGVGVDETRSTSTNNMYYGQFASSGGSVSKGHDRTFYLNMQQLLSWDRIFKDVHHVSVLLGHENYKLSEYTLSAGKSQMFSNDNDELNGSVVDAKASASSRDSYLNEGYFARAQYDYDNKLFFSASYRRDASSRFHPDHRWGDFWSAGAAWLINHEPWFNASWVDMLKLKASVGSQGNDNIANYLYTDTYTISNDNENGVATVFRTKGNPDITWETNTNFNAGVDFGFFGNRLSGTVEYFYRKTSDMLFYFTVPASLGYGGYYDNIGDMRNSGLEISLNGTIFNNRNFRWDVYANATHYTNKVIYLPEKNKNRTIEGHEGYANGNKFVGEGLPLNTFFMPKYAGVDHETGESLWYKDVLDEKGNVTGREKTANYSEATDYLCDDPTPKLYGGFGTSLEFYGFDVSLSFTYSIGGLTYDSGYASLMGSPQGQSVGSNIHKDILKAWSETNRDSNIPRWQYGDENNAAASDRFLTDASYLNFQNAQIGYTFPERLTKKIRVSRLRLYITCDNIIYWSRRQGLDPRYSFDGSTSYAVNSPVRTLSGGINITF